MRLTLLAALGLGVSSMSLAETKHNLSLDIDVSLSQSDNGAMKTDTNEPESSIRMNQNAFISYEGQTDDGVSFHTYFNLRRVTLEDATEIAKFEKKLGPVLVAVGKDYIDQAGWDNKNSGFATIISSQYTTHHMPLASSDTMLRVSHETGPIKASLQLTNDVYDDPTTTTNREYFNKNNQQPAMAFEFVGTFGNYKGLFQWTSYDINHSTIMSYGLGFDVAGLSGTFDYVVDTRAIPVAGDEEQEVQYTSMALDVVYKLASMSPFFKYTTLDVVQPGTDAKGNVDATTFEDNSQKMLVGVNLDYVSPNFTPYFAYSTHSGNILDPTDAEKTETKTTGTLIAGIGASIR